MNQIRTGACLLVLMLGLAVSTADAQPVPPPPANLVCDPIAGTGDIAMSWVNPAPYGTIRVTVDGAPWAVIPGSSTFFVVTGLPPGGHVLCVQGVIAGVASPPTCCQVFLPGGGPTQIGCDPLGASGDVAIAWGPGGSYTSIDIIVDGTVVATVPGTETFFTVTGLAPGPHVICVQAHDGPITYPPICCTVLIPGGPTPPSDLSCDVIFGTGDVALTWVNNSAYTGIEIYVDGTLVAVLPGGTTSFTVSGLPPGAHEICVRAITPTGALAVICCDVFIGIPPIGPLNCDPISGTNNVALAWTNPIVYDSIDIKVDGVVVATVPGTTTFFTVLGLSSGPHTICICGILGGDVVGEDCCEVTIGVPPIGPLNCDPIFGTNTVALAWSIPFVYDSIDIKVDGVVVATVPGGSTFFTVTGLTPGTHTICICGILGGAVVGEDCCEVTIGIPPIGPLNCDPLGLSNNVALAWANPIVYDSIDIKVDGVVVATVPGTTTFFTVTGLSGGTHEICICGILGGAVVGEDCCEVTIDVPPIGSLNCDPLGLSGDVAIAWTNPIVYDSIEIKVDGVVVATVPGTTEFFTVLGLSGGPHMICVCGILGGVSTGEACCGVFIPPSGGFVRGDCNVDAAYNLGDVVAVLNFLFLGTFSPSCNDACDINDDGTINLGDAVFALTNLFTGGSPPPAPHPACGPDPTADTLDCVSYPPCP